MDEDEMEQAREQSHKLAKQRLDALRSYLNVNGLSGPQIDEAMKLLHAFMESNAPLFTMMAQDAAERAEHHQALASEIEAERQNLSQQRQQRERAAQAEYERVLGTPVEWTVLISNQIFLPVDVTAASMKEAEEKALAEFNEWPHEKWLDEIATQGCDEVEIYTVNRA